MCYQTKYLFYFEDSLKEEYYNVLTDCIFNNLEYFYIATGVQGELFLRAVFVSGFFMSEKNRKSVFFKRKEYLCENCLKKYFPFYSNI